ncbi:AAA family ATPase [Qipengyuania sp. 1XM1-15A]|uniref:AAA family ATPase n=1 Tax=Qipengyuania xiamenensis TaxID=2867237 RepID=UPI001C86BDED|nr:AAA family ATPase [Qipengyuania xiamenensis]MBX7531881.1 AAA family ATPase [Qipengyuania xiamenensis]
MPEMLSLNSRGARYSPEGSAVMSVEDLGKIKNAEIEFSKFVMFVGKNSSGKSYLANIVWAVRSSFLGLGNNGENLCKSPKWFKDLLDSAKQSPDEKISISGQKILSHYNRFLARNFEKFAHRIFNHKSLRVGSIKFRSKSEICIEAMSKEPEWVRAELGESDFINVISSWMFSWSAEGGGSAENLSALIGLDSNEYDVIYRACVEKIIFGDLHAQWMRATYLPAARTGLVLSVSDLASSAFDPEPTSTRRRSSRFTAPMSRFIQDLIQSSDNSGRFNMEIVEFLERSIFGGELSITGRGVPEFRFVSKEFDGALPMHAVSSMITELTPFLALVSASPCYDGIIIEEPEAHLHLSAQRCMARALARLANSDRPIVATTHSDTFIQQINLLCRLADLSQPKMKALGYSKHDVLRRDDVRVYEFEEGNGRSFVKEAPFKEGGFVVNSINQTLFDLVDEVMELQE